MELIDVPDLMVNFLEIGCEGLSIAHFCDKELKESYELLTDKLLRKWIDKAIENHECFLWCTGKGFKY